MPDATPRVRSITVVWRDVVVKADPDFERLKRNDIEYEMSNGKKFYGNVAIRGAYKPAD